MSFLLTPNRQYRLYLQLKGFLSNTYANKVGELLKLPNFRLPDITLKESDISRLEMPDNLRLGNRLERFFSFLIQESKQYELLAENIQIIENKLTLGELDFLVFDTYTNQTLHIELGGKVYLYDFRIEQELARWIGPNRRDSLLNKTKKLEEKQFPLLYTESTKKILQKNNIEVDYIVQQVCLKARLFLPFGSIGKIPPYISKKNIKGYYVDIATFLESDFKSYSYFIPEKQDWIVSPKYGEKWLSHTAIIPFIESALLQKQSPLVWVRKSENIFETIIVVWW